MASKFVIMKVSKEFADIVNYIKARNILEGRKTTIIDITRKIAKNTDKEEIWRNEFIRI